MPTLTASRRDSTPIPSDNPASSRPKVVVGLVGPALDSGKGPERWDGWRPTVALGLQDDLLVTRFELLHQKAYRTLADGIAADLKQVSPESVVNLTEVALGDPWDFEDVYEALYGFARAYPFDPEREDYLVHITTGTHVAQICLFLLTEARYLPGKLLQTSPPRANTPGPGGYAVIDLDLSRYDRLASRFRKEQRAGLSFLKAGIETRNAAFNRLMEELEAVALASRAPLLLTGPTGAGKTQLARRLYDLKKSRRLVAGSFVEVNCATLRGDQAMSALFGHVRGAFTGATTDRPGLLRAADGGLLFLDEVGELGLDEQAMLLRALESKSFLPVGADREVTSDFLLIAGTNRDLGRAVAEGKFREDLLARLDTWTFRLPGLRERREDVEPNLAFELEQFAAREGTSVAFNAEARQRFLGFATGDAAKWRGNFRDLHAAVLRMATLAGGGRIGVEVVDAEIARLTRRWQALEQERADGDRVEAVLGRKAAALDRFDRVQLEDVLRVCAEAATLSEAGRRLFAQSRAKKANPNDADRLRKYLARFGLTWSEVRAR